MHAPSYYIVHASKEHLRDGADAVNTGGDVGELEVSRLGKVAIEDKVVVVDDGTDDGSHGNAAVLALNGTTTLEGLGLSLEPAEGIVNAERLGDTKLELRDGEVGSDPAGLGRDKRGGRSSKKGGDSELHLDVYINKMARGGVRPWWRRRGRGSKAPRATTKPRTFSRRSRACFYVIFCRSKQFNIARHLLFVPRLWYAFIRSPRSPAHAIAMPPVVYFARNFNTNAPTQPSNRPENWLARRRKSSGSCSRR